MVLLPPLSVVVPPSPAPPISKKAKPATQPRPDPPVTIARRAGAPPRPRGAAGFVSSTARFHRSISFDTPWNGFSGDGERTGSPLPVTFSPCTDILRSIRGDGGGTISPIVAARVGWGSRTGSCGSGERRVGSPLIDVPVLLLPNAFPYRVSRRPTGELRAGSPVGDVLCFATSRAKPPAVESGTARFALVSTGDVAGERFGKRVAAAEGDMSDVVDMDAALLVL